MCHCVTTRLCALSHLLLLSRAVTHLVCGSKPSAPLVAKKRTVKWLQAMLGKKWIVNTLCELPACWTHA